jgi:hypothetical protein
VELLRPTRPTRPTRPESRTVRRADRADTDKARADKAGTDAAVREHPGRESATSRGGDRILVCVRCGRPITTAGDRIEVDGTHEHTQINPHGFIWTFGCFAQAPGCVPVGAPSREFAWFAGTTWQIEQCGGCRTHLGWQFTSPDRRFHGLISDRIVEREADHPSQE